MKRRWLTLALVLATAAGPLRAEPLAREDVPEPLRPWIDWVLRGHESETCPFLPDADEHVCVWPGRLALRLDATGGSFEQDVFVAADSSFALPGGSGEGEGGWPDDVRVGGAAAPVSDGEGTPTLRLPRGSHRISGSFHWRALPPALAVPAETGLVALALDGKDVPFPRRDASGRLWLRDAGAAPARARSENRVDVDVHRRLVDGVPIRLESVITLRVSGEAREEKLGVALPEHFVPVALSGGLPVRLDPDGRLRAQLRPGEWRVVLDARLAGRGDSFAPPKQPSARGWDPIEIWSVAPAPALRRVDVEGAPPIDPTQTEMPPEWRGLAAYRMESGAALRLVEKSRGIEGGAADRIALSRTWYLDFDGGGATVLDSLQGTLRESMRLEMGARTALGRAAVAGADQPITKRAGAGLGVEVPLGEVAIEADSRVEQGVRRMPAVGWEADVDSLAGELELPPGYRLFHATGVDTASPTWISSWNLLDVFLVMIVSVALWRLAGVRPAALALAALALSYTEPGAPRLVWVALAAAEALRRVAPRAGWIARAVQGFQLAAVLTLVAIAVPFAVAQIRAGLFPALERPSPGFAAEAGLFTQGATQADLAVPAAAPALAPQEIVTANKRARAFPMAAREAAMNQPSYAPDPNASVPTGPGRPQWTWERVSLAWSGPVGRDQELGLWLIPPSANAVLAFVRVGLIAALAFVWLRLRGRGATPSAAGGVPAVAAALAAILVGAPARADFPTPELLDALRSQLLEPAECQPSCAALSRAALSIGPARLDLRLALDAAAETAVPLPGGADDAAFRASSVVLDGAPASALLRDEQGTLWLRVARGRHEVLLSGALPPRASVSLPFPLIARRVELASADGWTVVGIDPSGAIGAALQLVRLAPRESQAGEGALEPTEIPPFVEVVRTLSLGLTWGVETRVRRLAPTEGTIVIELPLLPGEAVTTPNVRVAQGRALVTLGAGEPESSFASTLATAERIQLVAPKDASWTEEWRVALGPLWHLEAEGIPPVDEVSAGARARTWRPWPGERVTLAIDRPAGEKAPTLTIDRSELTLRPGLRAADATLELTLRSSQGGQHAITLPEGAELTQLRVNDAVQPLRQEGRRVPLTLAPGVRRVALDWREPRELGALVRGSAVDLGAPSVNASVQVAVPERRWVLFVGGPRLGPSVLFWPTLAVIAGLALALARLGLTPLRAWHWLLLGVGLTQAPLPASALVVVWLLALGVRGRYAEPLAGTHRVAFDMLQLALVGLTLAAGVGLVVAIQTGLLGSPTMRIGGNDSDATLLRWYQDRADALLPTPWMLSLSIWWYRLAMLAWALWLALALVGWLRWGFAQWSAGGAWRPLRKAPA